MSQRESLARLRRVFGVRSRTNNNHSAADWQRLTQRSESHYISEQHFKTLCNTTPASKKRCKSAVKMLRPSLPKTLTAFGPPSPAGWPARTLPVADLCMASNQEDALNVGQQVCDSPCITWTCPGRPFIRPFIAEMSARFSARPCQPRPLRG